MAYDRDKHEYPAEQPSPKTAPESAALAPEFNSIACVVKPDDMLVGKPDGGWSLAVSTMAVERTAIGNYVSIDRADALRRVAEVAGSEQDAALRALGEIETAWGAGPDRPGERTVLVPEP